MARLIFDLWRMRRMKQADPALADRIPPGQTLTTKWPVLTYGLTPRLDLARWTFRCFGLVEEEVRWTWEEFLRLPRVRLVSDVHCVTRWSKLDNEWEGVSIREILGRVRLKPGVRYVLVHADPDYTTNVALDDLAQDDVLLALTHNGRDLEPDHGGPCRLVVPRLYFWKSAKWLRAFEFLDVNPPGFWEQNGYHMRADPWQEERYSDQETNAMQKMRAEAARRLRDRGPA
jgi:DMSO/TMAO reductase YedYZ molybdopterin-dependent catalytic subunit